ncbi:hypothetical protein BDK51DRAFT_52624 [Blyttiomyces helicus]|uniref:Uncharacterized protein n=1 Tax=Blyttiomyces helicus TaxID=388810 RepID=A0A4P9WQS3_9FUNG|nr:hypothetical protein BDK51DRAFT_52624 [Blyttiomyces helicus]|eukprot:RKO94755.1 hypothetical protein BDK51DRAFT_52624 [Blyttiomyces helicus]
MTIGSNLICESAFSTIGTSPVMFSNPAQSTSTSTGSVVIAGGTGIASHLYVGGLGVYVNTMSTTSTSYGALIVAVGVGIGGDLNVAGNGTFDGNLTVHGNLDSAA